MAYEGLGNYALARDWFSSALKRDPTDVSAQLNFAFLLATSNDPSVRDGKQALALAKSACSSKDCDETVGLTTLGAAFAACGDFPSAIKAMEKAIMLEKRLEPRKELARHLELYKSGLPYRRSN